MIWKILKHAVKFCGRRKVEQIRDESIKSNGYDAPLMKRIEDYLKKHTVNKRNSAADKQKGLDNQINNWLIPLEKLLQELTDAATAQMTKRMKATGNITDFSIVDDNNDDEDNEPIVAVATAVPIDDGIYLKLGARIEVTKKYNGDDRMLIRHLANLAHSRFMRNRYY